jgi:transcriptional accessory protein Tex/SPT6
MANRFVKDPRDVVKPGDVVRVTVRAVDVPRNRIGLSLRADDPAEGAPCFDTPTAARPPSAHQIAASRLAARSPTRCAALTTTRVADSSIICLLILFGGYRNCLMVTSSLESEIWR